MLGLEWFSCLISMYMYMEHHVHVHRSWAVEIVWIL